MRMHNNMLPKNRRLGKKEFSTVYETGKNVSGEIGYFKITQQSGISQFACVAAKKETRRSVDRTRIRRRGYAAIRECLEMIPEGYGIIWFLPPLALDTSFQNLVSSVEEAVTTLQKV